MRILLLFLLTFNLYAATSIKSGKGIRLYKNDNAFYTELRASTNTSATVTYSLPNADGTNGQVLMTNGTGSLTWATIPTGTASYATEWTPYTPVYTGFGTVSNSEMHWRKEGSDIWIRGRFTAGTTTAVEARMSLPIVSGATLTTSSSVGALTIGGFAGRGDNSSTFYAVNYEASKQYVNFGCGINSTCSFGNKNNGNLLLSAGQELIIQPTKININGWDNVVRAVVGTQYALTVTGTNWTTTRAVGIPYVTSDGTWRLKFNIVGSVASASRTGVTLTVSGVTFKALSGYSQAVTAARNGTYQGAIAWADQNASTITVNHVSDTTTYYAVSGDVELESKPSWVTFTD